MDFPHPARALSVNFLTLAAVPAAVGRSRELVRLGLDRWGLASLAADAEMVVSELATNAIQATGRTDADATWNDVGRRRRGLSSAVAVVRGQHRYRGLGR